MKRKYKQILAGVLAASTILTFAACNGSGQSSENGSSAASSRTQSSAVVGSRADSSQGESQSAAAGQYATIEEYVNSADFQEQVKALNESMESGGMKIDITADENKLIYTFTYPDNVPTDGLQDALKAALETQADTFNGIVTSLKSAVGIENPIVVVAYNDSTGKEIYSQEFAG